MAIAFVLCKTDGQNNVWSHQMDSPFSFPFFPSTYAQLYRDSILLAVHCSLPLHSFPYSGTPSLRNFDDVHQSICGSDSDGEGLLVNGRHAAPNRRRCGRPTLSSGAAISTGVLT
ncbi:hypothetical protein QTP88_015468 [Uroleucon formosanum]